LREPNYTNDWARLTNSSVDPDDSFRVSPERGNVAFASAQMGWCFTLRTFAAMYADTFGSFDVDEFAARLWGNIYFDSARRKFTRKPADQDSPRSFVHFVLEPLYKLYTQVSGLSRSVGSAADSSAGDE
jgi:U5 small nuclear ribonucleoprotein component